MPLPQPFLGVVGLGTVGDPDLQDGNHLRWAFLHDLGFPKYGWSIYRRACDNDVRSCINLCNAKTRVAANGGAHVLVIDNVIFDAGKDVIRVAGGQTSNNPTVVAVRVGCALELPSVTRLVVNLPTAVAAVTIDVEGDMFEVAAYNGTTLVTTPMMKMGSGPQEITIDTGSIEPGSFFPTTFDRLLIVAKNARITAFCTVNKSTAFNPTSWEGPLNAEPLALTTNAATALNRIPTAVRPAYKKTIQGLLPTVQSLLVNSPTPYVDRSITYNNSLAQGANEPAENGKAQFGPKSLDMLLMMALDPYVARALGLLFVDETVVELGKAFDYLVVAHYTAAKALDHAAIAWSVVYGPHPPLDPPAGLHATAVPTGTIQGQNGVDIPTTSAGGLKWTLPNLGGALAMNAAVCYQVYRTHLPGNTAAPPPFPSMPGPFKKVSPLPVVVGRSDDGYGNLVYPANYYLDFTDGSGPLLGWYAYALRGIDVFGRRSAFSQPDRVRILQRVPPPPPAKVRAKYVVHGDPLLGQDEADLVPNPGDERLIVTWEWTQNLATQAPRVLRFTIYAQDAFPPYIQGQVTSVSDAGNGTYVVHTNISVTDPSQYQGGTLLAGNSPLSDPKNEAQADTYFVQQVTAGGNTSVTILPKAATTGLVIPTAGESCRLSVGTGNQSVWKSPPVAQVPALPAPSIGPYAPDLSGKYSLALPPGMLKKFASIGVSTTVTVPASTEELEGFISGPKQIAAFSRTPPPPPFVDISVLISGPVDFYGNSIYAVNFTPQAGVKYQIARALDATVAAAAGLSLTAFLAMSHTAQRAAATAHPEAFSLRNNTPATVSPYLDTLPGRSRSFFFYIVRSVDAVGNHGPWSQSTPPVRAPHTTPPLPPVLKSALSPAERTIVLSWLPSPEPDIVEYRVFKALTEADATDLRLMRRSGTVPFDPAQVAAKHVSYTDHAVRGGLLFYYRIVAVQSGDNGENVSDSSNVLASPAQDHTPPVPPTITGFTRVNAPASIRVNWTIPAGEVDLHTLVQRRESGATIWQTLKVGSHPLGTRLPVGTKHFLDKTVPDMTKSYEYRLNVVNTAGNTATSAVVKSTP